MSTKEFANYLKEKQRLQRKWAQFCRFWYTLGVCAYSHTPDDIRAYVFDSFENGDR